MNTYEALTSRKSVRSYTGEQISDEDLQKILVAANAAPIAMGRYEDVHLTVIQSPELLAKIDAAGAAMMGRPDVHPLYGAPTFVLVSAKVPEGDLGAENVAFSNAAIVVENMSLEAVELGIGTCHIWGAVRAINKDPNLVAELGLPEGFSPCCGVILGASTETYAEREVPTDRISQNVIA